MFHVENFVDSLKSIAEPTRLRILTLLADGDLTVTDLTTILGQSQPRVSRHLKLLLEAGLINRWQEGAWALFRAVSSGPKSDLVRWILAELDTSDPIIVRDFERLEEVKARRRAAATEYFAANAASWDEIRAMHVADADVEAAVLELAGKQSLDAVLDIGTGTGRMLELFAPHCRTAVGIDASREMLGVARSNLEEAKIQNAEVRLGDVYNMPVPRGSFDLVLIHQVLHFLDDPASAIKEAARSLAPSGRLIVVDFAPHEKEFLRTDHQHQRLGFDNQMMENWLAGQDLKLTATKALTPAAGESNDLLTVVIWVAEDQRIQFDAPPVGETSILPETVA